MPIIYNHTDGTPVWSDVTVRTPEEQSEMQKFMSALFSWTWEIGPTGTGDYCVALHAGQPVTAVGRTDVGRGEAVTYFATTDLQGATSRAVKLGGELVAGPRAVGDRGALSLVLDPTGAMHGLWEAKNFRGFGVAYEPNTPGWFDHLSPRPGDAEEYYTALTGHRAMEFEPGRRILHEGEKWFASLSALREATEQSRWSPIFVVDELERFRHSVTLNHGTIVIEALPVPGSNLCVFTEPVCGTTMTVMEAGMLEPERPVALVSAL